MFPMLPFCGAVSSDLDAMNQLILEQLSSDVALVEEIGRHLIAAGGKRLRPLVVLLAARACGYTATRHIELAVIIEFIHTATLLHDDVVDTSELRRGRFTANAQWGNAPSVLVGDFLYSRAFQMMVALDDLQIMKILADTTNTISEGEVEQLVNVGDTELAEASYLRVIGNKTAQLFAGSSHCAGILAGTEPRLADALQNYGWHLGMAFQLIDDTLDYDGDAATLGKNAGDDLAEGKITLPLIHALRCGSAVQRQQLCAAINDRDSAQLANVINIIQTTGSLAYTIACAHKHATEAKHTLAGLPRSAYRDALGQLADFAVDRQY